MPLPKQGQKIGNCGNAIAENGREKKLEWNCCNGIAEVGEIFFCQLWQCHFRKWEEKKNFMVAEICGGI